MQSNHASGQIRSNNPFDTSAHEVLLVDMRQDANRLPDGCVAAIPCVPDRVSITQRLLEIIVAGSALILVAPLLLIIAIVIRLDTPGPVLFKQKRLGRGGDLFTFIKFRTLYADAKQRFPELYEYKYGTSEIQTMIFKQETDPRITPRGRWLRSSSLDELPNLLLVLTGKMSLVGPRPQIPEMLPYYKGVMLERFSVRPGLTDLAHVSGRSSLSFYETSAMDVVYVRERSWRLDLSILLRTLRSVILREGAF